MKKLTLEVEELTVTSFETVEPEVERGTVEGNAEMMITGNYPTCTTCLMTKVNTCCTP
ncbi:MAG TPA: hypothetical protein VEX86_27510 [Longimicrobium sp.]|nr:hypothetical protein [Longimicrobium sp.]